MKVSKLDMRDQLYMAVLFNCNLLSSLNVFMVANRFVFTCKGSESCFFFVYQANIHDRTWIFRK